MPKSQIHWPLRLALIVVVVCTGLAELRAQKAPAVSFDRGFAPLVKQILPAVVNIESSRIVLTSPQTDSLFQTRCSTNSSDSTRSLASGVSTSTAWVRV